MPSEERVSIIIRAQDFASRVMGRVDRAIDRTIASVKRFALGLGAFAASAAFVGKKLFDLGSSVEETNSKFETVFGRSSAAMGQFVDDFGTLAGLSRKTAKDLTATTGSILQGLGFLEDQSAKTTQEITRLAGDLGSFNNLPTADAIEAINAALTGEFERLKQFGIVVRAAEIQQLALAQSGKTTAAALTIQEKATAALEIITRRAGRANGDLARTMDSPANKAKQIGAEFRTIAEDFATKMLPVLSSMLPVVEQLLDRFAGLADKSARFAKNLAEGLGLIDPLDPVLEREQKRIQALDPSELPAEQSRLHARRAGIASQTIAVAREHRLIAERFNHGKGVTREEIPGLLSMRPTEVERLLQLGGGELRGSSALEAMQLTQSLLPAMQADMERQTVLLEMVAQLLTTANADARATARSRGDPAFLAAMVANARVVDIAGAPIDPRLPPKPKPFRGFVEPTEVTQRPSTALPFTNDEASDEFGLFTDAVRGGLDDMVRAATSGSADMSQAVSGAFAQILASLPGPFGIAGGLFGGVLGTLFRGNEPVPVHIKRDDTKPVDQTFVINLLGPDGNIERTIHTIRQRERQDGIVRLPAGFSGT